MLDRKFGNLSNNHWNKMTDGAVKSDISKNSAVLTKIPVICAAKNN